MDALKEELNAIKTEKSKAHEKIYTRLNELEKAQAVSVVQYENVMKMLTEQGKTLEKVEAKQDKEFEKLENKLNELIEKPSKRWDSVIMAAIAAIIGGLIAYGLQKIGLKG